MGKKSDRKAGEEAPVKKKKRKADAPAGEPLMLGVQRCPPASRLSFEWVVGNGIGKNAVRDALQAYERAWPARLERADRDARSPEAQKCGKGCTAGRVNVYGPIAGTQHWRIDSETDPMTATTWNWVGFFTVCDCGP
jgi:hypothetical protein